MKKSILKKFSIPLLTLSMLISSLAISTNVFAAPEVIIASEAEDIPNDIVQQITEENPNADVINILGYGDSSESIETKIDETINTNIPEKKGITDMPSNKIATSVTTKPVTSKSITNRKQVAKDVFKFSVAKGKHVTLDHIVLH